MIIFNRYYTYETTPTLYPGGEGAIVKKIVMFIVLVLGIAVLAGGITSIVIGRANAGDVTNNLKSEKISLAVFDENAPKDAIISNASQARLAIDTLIKHRQGISPTYSDLLGGKHFDPTNPEQLTYAQAMNLQNSMTTAVLAYGLTTVLTVNGILLLVIGVALILVAVIFWWPRATLVTQSE
jgi:hypothetical protein